MIYRTFFTIPGMEESAIAGSLDANKIFYGHLAFVYWKKGE